jgi:ribonuclease HI
LHLTFHIDGGSRGNPGPAACAVIGQDAATEKTIHEAGYYIGNATNNVAEYRALLRALDLAIELGASAVSVVSDSELMVRQVTGAYKVKSDDLKPLYDQAQKKLLSIDTWSLKHVLRDKNKRADELANMALDAGRDVVLMDATKTHGPAPGSAPGSGHGSSKGKTHSMKLPGAAAEAIHDDPIVQRHAAMDQDALNRAVIEAAALDPADDDVLSDAELADDVVTPTKPKRPPREVPSIAQASIDAARRAGQLPTHKPAPEPVANDVVNGDGDDDDDDERDPLALPPVTRTPVHAAAPTLRTAKKAAHQPTSPALFDHAGKSPAASSAAGTTEPVPQWIVRFTTAPDAAHHCPGKHRQGQMFSFGPTTPAGVCLFAAESILADGPLCWSAEHPPEGQVACQRCRAQIEIQRSDGA